MDWSRRFEQVFACGGDAMNQRCTQIGAGAHVIGDVISADSVELNGRITGRLVSANGQQTGRVLVKAKGSLQGHLAGDAVTILGQVQGTVRSMGVLQLGADAQVEADLGYGDLYIQPGAVVKGVLSPITPQTVPMMPNLAKA